MRLVPPLIMALLSACAPTRLVMDSRWDPSSPPVYVDYHDYYLLGFIGSAEVNLRTVCLDQRPLAVESVRGFDDGLISLYTLGIYSPMTVKVWCGD
jgi:hypothetical protein